MRNVTIVLDDTVADWSRIWAATHQTSVSRMLGELLAEKMADEEHYSVAMADYLAAPVVAVSTSDKPAPAHPYLSRDAAHER